MPFLKYKRLKLKLRVFLAGHGVAMVTYCVTKMIPTCSPMIEQYFDTMIVASSDKEEPSKSISWKVLETVMSHLKMPLYAFKLALLTSSRVKILLNCQPQN